MKFGKKIKEWFNSLSPIEQDIFLAIIAGVVGVGATWIIAKWLREEST